MLWTYEDLIVAIDATPYLPGGGAPEGVTGLSIDTRTLAPGEAYFAILGDVHDGHDFVDAAGEAGAALAVVSREKAEAAGELPLLIVDDVLVALEALGRAARARTAALVVAVTGSVGKTTTKELLRTVLEPSGQVHAAVASFNNHWGVPLTLARMPEDAKYAVVEIGMNHPGEITPLVQMARPHVAMVTKVAAAHLGAFASVDEIATAKAEIFEGLDAKGVAVLNANDPRLGILRSAAEKCGVTRFTTFGHEKNAVVDFKLVRYGPDEAVMNVEIAGRAIEARLGAPGQHMAMNATAALGTAFLLGADLEAGAAALASFTAGKGRGERHVLAHPDGPIALIDESYNANPASMRAALTSLKQTKPGEGGRRIAVLGDMLELGEHSRRKHELLREPLAKQIDAVWLVGPEMRALFDRLEADRLENATPDGEPNAPELRWFETTPELATIIADEVHGHDVVMVKSSLGLRFATLVDALIAAHPPVEQG